MNVLVETAVATHLVQLTTLDRHLTSDQLAQKIERAELLVALQGDSVIGWLRFSFFWDLIPFMNMLGVREAYRKQGIGTRLVQTWEAQMQEQGCDQVLTSTQSDEDAQFFHRKMGYQDCGALLLPNEPLEILLRKRL